MIQDQQINTVIGWALPDSKHFSSGGHDACQGDGSRDLSCIPSPHITCLMHSPPATTVVPYPYPRGLWFSLVLTEEGDGRIPLSGWIGHF